MADLRERIVIDAVDNTTKGFRSAQNKLNAFDRTAKRLQTTLLGFVGVNIFGHLIAGLARASDNAIELEAKLRLMTDGTEDYNAAQKELVKISLETGTSLEANTILFTRMNRPVQALGGTTKTTLKITKLMAQGLRISGASAQESASVIRQYSQAMSSSVLRGEEFNAIMENGGRIAVALAKGLGVPIGALREMAEEGLLTAKTVNDALLSQADVINNEASQLPLTMGRALQNINTKWTTFLQNNKEANSIIAEGIQFVANNFEVIKDILINGGLVGFFILMSKHIQTVRLETTKIVLEEKKRAIQSKITSIQQLKSANDKNVSDRAEIARKQELKLLDAEIAILKNKTVTVEKLSAIERKKEQVAKLLGKEKEKVILAEISLAKSIDAIKDKEIAVTKASDNLRELKSSKETLVTSQQIKTAKDQFILAEKGLHTTLGKSLIAHEANIVAQTKLREITTSLAEATTIANKATFTSTSVNTKHTGALSNNTIAQNVWIEAKKAGILYEKRTIASTTQLNIVQRIATGVVGRLSVAVGILGKAFFRLTSLIFGLPGLIALIAYEVLNFMGVDFGLHLKALGATFTNLWIKTKRFFGVFSDGEAKKALDENDKQFSDWSKKRIADAQAVKAGFKDSAEQIDELTQNQMALKAKASAEIKRQLDERSKDRAEALTALETNLDAELKAVKFNLGKQIEAEQETKIEIIRVGNEFTQKRIEQNESNNAVIITSEEQLQAKLFIVEKDFTQKKFNAKSASLEAELADVNSFYAERIKDVNKNEAELLANNKIAYEQSSIELKAKLNADIEAESNTSVQRLDYTKVSLAERQTVYYGGLNDLTKLNEDYEKNLSELTKSSQNGRRIITDSHEAKLYQSQKENAEAIKKVAESMVKHLRTQLNEMRGEYDDYSNKSKNILKGIQEFERRVFGDKRTEYEKTSDALKESGTIDADLRKSDLLDQQGNVKEATKLREITLEKLKELTESQKTRANEAKKGSKAQIDADRISKRGMGQLITETGKLKKGYDDMTASLATRIKSSEDAVKTYIKVVDEADKKLNEVKEIQIKTNADQANKELQSIVDKLAKIKDKTITMTVNRVENNTVKKANGGLIEQYADGGFIPRKDKVPGTGNQDTVKALLTPGEFVIKKSSVAKYGYDFLRALNQGDAEPQKFADGGSVQKFAEGGSVDYRVDRMSTKYFEMLEEFQNTVSTTNGVRGWGRQNQSAYYGQYLLKQFVPHLSKLKDMPDSTITKVDDLIKKVLRNVTQGATGGFVFKGNVTRGKYTLDLLNILLNSNFEWFKKPTYSFKESSSLKPVKRDKSSKNNFERFAKGGQAKGSGLGDTVKALLTPGEFVIRNSAVQKFGSDFFNSINQGIMPQKFANGGLVGDGVSGEVITVNFNMNGKRATGTFPNTDATKTLLDSLKQAGASS